MTHRWLTRALIAAVALVLAPIAASSATAAPAAPAVPTLAQVAKIYPGLDGGEVYATRESVKNVGKKCESGKKVAGAAERETTYSAKTDPSSESLGVTGAAPIVDVTAERLPSVRLATRYFSAGQAQFKRCAQKGEGDFLKIQSMAKVRFTLGDQRVGYRATTVVSGMRARIKVLHVRTGRLVFSIMTMSLDKTTPSLAKTLQVARLALRTAR